MQSWYGLITYTLSTHSINIAARPKFYRDNYRNLQTTDKYPFRLSLRHFNLRNKEM
jgi:hypothetical protein